MIIKGSLLVPMDNSGVWRVGVFHLYRGFLKKKAVYGNFVKVSVKSNKLNSVIPKKTKTNAILILSRFRIVKLDGSSIYFKNNFCVLLKKRLQPVGKEIIGPGNYLLLRKKFLYSFSGVI